MIVDYNSEWPQNFQKISDKLKKACLDIQTDIQHVGSTSVPNLAAKPIIDIDIIYYETSDFEPIKHRLELIDYFHNGSQGIVGREVFKRNGQKSDTILDTISHHLYVCKSGSLELQRHILFRDYLKKNELARIYYQNLKLEYAKEANNERKLYAQIKEDRSNSFINFVIELEKMNRKNEYNF
jgi:GrpB-like predicted nucleotidyltransferase (UPF0157 family)